VPGRPTSTTRRGALGGALGGVLGGVTLAACDVDDLRPPEDEATPVPSPTPGASETPEPDADTVLVERLVAEILDADTAVDVAREFRRLREPLKGLRAMHRAHLGVLVPTDTTTRTATSVPADAVAALAQVRRAEQRLQRILATGAVEAQSGALARLLASMSASVAQHLYVLPRAPRAEPTEGGP
jgi:hypothetical protein